MVRRDFSRPKESYSSHQVLIKVLKHSNRSRAFQIWCHDMSNVDVLAYILDILNSREEFTNRIELFGQNRPKASSHAIIVKNTKNNLYRCDDNPSVMKWIHLYEFNLDKIVKIIKEEMNIEDK